MKDIFKKLFYKESKSEPVKKERTYLNNTQILNAVQERMDKTNEKLDILISDLSIISKYFEDILRSCLHNTCTCVSSFKEGNQN